MQNLALLPSLTITPLFLCFSPIHFLTKSVHYSTSKIPTIKFLLSIPPKAETHKSPPPPAAGEYTKWRRCRRRPINIASSVSPFSSSSSPSPPPPPPPSSPVIIISVHFYFPFFLVSLIFCSIYISRLDWIGRLADDALTAGKFSGAGRLRSLLQAKKGNPLPLFTHNCITNFTNNNTPFFSLSF